MSRRCYVCLFVVCAGVSDGARLALRGAAITARPELRLSPQWFGDALKLVYGNMSERRAMGGRSQLAVFVVCIMQGAEIRCARSRVSPGLRAKQACAEAFAQLGSALADGINASVGGEVFTTFTYMRTRLNCTAGRMCVAIVKTVVMSARRPHCDKGEPGALHMCAAVCSGTLPHSALLRAGRVGVRRFRRASNISRKCLARATWCVHVHVRAACWWKGWCRKPRVWF